MFLNIKIFKESNLEKNNFDFRAKDLSKEDFSSFSLEDFVKKIKFDTLTIWPSEEKLPKGFDPKRVLENGKNPGLKVKEIHNKGIDGRDIVVAIIDQKLDVNHQEYSSNLINYNEYGGAEKERISMHGPAVASLLVGKDCGVAPGAKLVYKAVPSGRNFLFYAQALEDIIEENKKLTFKEKIRVVSCSIGYNLSKNRNEKGLDKWLQVLKKADKEGIFVVDAVGDMIGLSFIGGGSFENKDNFDTYFTKRNSYGFYSLDKKILIPSDCRTMASSWNKEGQYMYNGMGGISWSVPYLAGIICLILQLKPDISKQEIVKAIIQTSVLNKKKLRIVNPEGIINFLTS